MELSLKGKVVLVTGGTKGIGLSCARAFVDEGARVAIVSRSRCNVDLACEKLGITSGFSTDLADPQAALTLVGDVEQRLGPIDVLVNSAGATRRTPPQELSPASFRAAMDAKFFTYINVIDPVIKLMAKRKSGVIVNVIGNGGKIASPVHIPGGAANSALMLVTAGLAAAYAREGIRVVGVNPGLTHTERVEEGLEAGARFASISMEEARDRSIAGIPLGRMAEPAEIANVVLFLASEKSSYVTGVTLSMDGAASSVII